MNALEVRGLDAFYGDFQALFSIDFELAENETVAAIGANGAGKSTLLRAICGLAAARAERLAFRGRSIQGRAPCDIVGLGIVMVPEGRRLFPSLSVEENLSMGGYRGRPGPWTLARIYDLFPVLYDRRSVPGTALSGGEQQMAAIGRALMANPELILFDELSLGLAPVVVKEIYEVLPRVKRDGAAMVVVEQDVHRALSVADRVYCLQEGRVSLTGAPAALTRERIAAAYFGA